MKALLRETAPRRAACVAALALATLGLVGIAVQGALVRLAAFSLAWPSFLGLWLAVLTFSFGLEAVFQLRGTPLVRCRCCTVVFNSLLLFAAALLSIVSFVGYRLDGGLWALGLSAALALATWASARRPLGGTPASDDDDNDEDERLPSSSVNGGGSAFAAAAATFPLPPSSSSSTARGAAFSALKGDDDSAGDESIEPHADGCCAQACSARRRACLLQHCHACLWGVCGLVLLLLLGGASVQAYGWRAFPPRGAFYAVALPDGSGATVSVHAWCSGGNGGGGANASLPSFWLEVGGGGHSSADTLNLQFALNDRGHRVCTYDPPGTGWSGPTSPAAPQVTAQLMDAMGEAGPFILIGAMDDGPSRIYRYALDHPASVRGLVPMQYAPPEFLLNEAYYGWTGAAARANAAAALAGRALLGDAIRGIAVQFGLMPLLVPSSSGEAFNASASAFAGYSPATLASYAPERLALNLFNEKQWTTQCFILHGQVADIDSVFEPDLWSSNRSLAPSIPVLALGNAPAGTLPCTRAGYPVGSDDCGALLYAIEQGLAFMQNMTLMTPGSAFINCEDAWCAETWLGDINSAAWVADRILEHFGDTLA